MSLIRPSLIALAAIAALGVAPARAGIVSAELHEATAPPHIEFDEDARSELPHVYTPAYLRVPYQSRRALESLMTDRVILPGPDSSVLAFGNMPAVTDDANDVPEPVGPALVLTGLLLLILRRCMPRRAVKRHRAI